MNIITIVSEDLKSILSKLKVISCSKSNYELYVDYINQCIEDNLLDDISIRIVESDQYLINLTEDLDPIEGISRIMRVVLQTVIDIDDNRVWYCILCKINYNTLILFIESFLINQDIMNTLTKYYSSICINRKIMNKLIEVSESNGFEIMDEYDSSNNTNIDNNIDNNIILCLVISADIEDLRSLACTCVSIRRYILSNLDMISSKHQLYRLDSFNTLRELVKFHRSMQIGHRLDKVVKSKIINSTEQERAPSKIQDIYYDDNSIVMRDTRNSALKDILTVAGVGLTALEYAFHSNYDSKHMTVVIVAMIKNYPTHIESIIQYIISLSSIYKRSDNIHYITGNHENILRRYMCKLMDDSEYYEIHCIIILNKRTIKYITRHLLEIIKSKDVQAISDIFLPIEKDLISDNIIRFVNNEWSSTKWGEINIHTLYI